MTEKLGWKSTGPVFGGNPSAIAQAVHTLRQGHNPDGLPASGEPEMSPHVAARVRRGEITSEDAREIGRSNQTFNDRMRGDYARKGHHLVGNTSDALGEQMSRPDPAEQLAHDRAALREAATEIFGAERANALLPDKEQS